MLMALLESMLLDKREKTLYIACIAFSTLFFIGAALFNGPRKIMVKLASYYLYLMRYQDNQFAHHFQFRF